MAQSIWGASAVTPAATDRIPVDVSAAGAPSRWTGQDVANAPTSIGVTVNALGSINTNTTIDLANGAYVTATIAGALTFTFSNPPSSGQGMQFVLVLTNGGSAVVTWPGSVTWTGGTAPTLRSSGVDVLRFYTSNAGTNWYGELAYDEQSLDASAIATGTIAAARLPAATTTASGAVELATVAECQAGTDTTRATTPEGVAAAIAALASGGSPGGSSGQLQYNNAGAFDGASLWREDANTITQRNGANAQAGRWANTWTDSSNYELGRAQWVSNVFTIGTLKAGTGSARGLALQVDGANVVSWHSATLQATFAHQTNHSADIVGIGSYPRLIAFRIAIGPILNTSYTYTTADCGGIAIATSASDQTFTTPASPGSGTQFGMRVGSSKTSYLRINANTGQKIRLAGGLSASAGYVRSNVAGSFVWLIYDTIDAEWVAWQQGGTWTIDS